jgi:hypothetical protein
MATYSFRAECPADIDLFEQQCVTAYLNTAIRRVPDPVFPDVDAEMEVGVPLDAMRCLMRQMVNGHVMLQTLRACPLSENSLERDNDLS